MSDQESETINFDEEILAKEDTEKKMFKLGSLNETKDSYFSKDDNMRLKGLEKAIAELYLSIKDKTRDDVSAFILN